MTRWHSVGFLRRDNPNGMPSSAGSAGPGGHVGIGRGEVGECAQMVVEGMHDAPIGRETLELLQVGLPYLIQRDCSDETVIAGQTAARLGYLSRSVEFVRYEAARVEDDELYEALAERFDVAEAQGESLYDAMADLAAAMASGEPVDPSPGEGGPSWTLPGLNAEARSMLRDRLLAGMRTPPDIEVDDLKRTWKYGYFLRALDELTEDEE